MLDDMYFNMYVVDLIALFCFLHPFLGNAFQVTDFAFSLCVVDLNFLIYTCMERERVVLRISEPPQLTSKLSANSVSSVK
ncbi:hypothetical protein Hanom_Chr09g00854551 [Helianthus anomalus]